MLGLEPLLQEIKSEVDELDELLERQSRQEEARREKILGRTLTWLNLVIMPILLAATIFGMNIKEFTGCGFSFWEKECWLIFVATCSVLFLFFLLFLGLHFLIGKFREK